MYDELKREELWLFSIIMILPVRMTLSEPEWQFFILSLKVSSVTALFSLPFGILIAFLLARGRFPAKSLLDGIIHLPLVPSLQLNVTLPSKGITALLGVAGAGKTSLLNAIAGLEPPPQGQIILNERRLLDSEKKLIW